MSFNSKMSFFSSNAITVLTDEDIKNQLWDKYLLLKKQPELKKVFLELYGETKCSLFTLLSMWVLYHFCLQNQIENYLEYQENSLTITPYVAIPMLVGCATLYSTLRHCFYASSAKNPKYFVKDALNNNEIALWNQYCIEFADLCKKYDKPISVDKFLLNSEAGLYNAMLNAQLFISTKKNHPVIINMLVTGYYHNNEQLLSHNLDNNILKMIQSYYPTNTPS